MLGLPKEIWFEIFSYLTIKELCSAIGVNKALMVLGNGFVTEYGSTAIWKSSRIVMISFEKLTHPNVLEFVKNNSIGIDIGGDKCIACTDCSKQMATLKTLLIKNKVIALKISNPGCAKHATLDLLLTELINIETPNIGRVMLSQVTGIKHLHIQATPYPYKFVEYSNYSDRNLASFFKNLHGHFASLKTLELTDCSRASYQTMNRLTEFVAHIPGLEKINLSGLALNYSNNSVNCFHPEEYIESCLSIFFNSLQKLKGLHTLDLSNVQFLYHKDHMKALAKLLENSLSLKTLNISCNNPKIFQPANNFVDICKFITNNYQVKNIDLSGLQLTETDILNLLLSIRTFFGTDKEILILYPDIEKLQRIIDRKPYFNVSNWVELISLSTKICIKMEQNNTDIELQALPEGKVKITFQGKSQQALLSNPPVSMMH